MIEAIQYGLYIGWEIAKLIAFTGAMFIVIAITLMIIVLPFVLITRERNPHE